MGGGKINPNLLTGTRDFRGFNPQGLWLENNEYQGCKQYAKTTPWAGIFKKIAIEAGKWYTFSLTLAASAGMDFFIFLGSDGKDTTGLSQCAKRVISNGRMRAELTFYCSANRTIIPRIESGVNGYYAVCQYKLEEGKKATPWCPNIND